MAEFFARVQAIILSVTRLRLLLLIVSFTAPAAMPQEPVQEPPEEDISLQPKNEYVLNPLQADKEIRVGNYYLKKGSNKAALRRYEEAIKWDPNTAEGWYRLGEAHSKLSNQKGVREAWTKYLALEPEGKYASVVKKRLSQKP